MSKLSSWWHDFVNGLGISDSVKGFLNAYGLYFIWGGAVAILLFLFWLVC